MRRVLQYPLMPAAKLKPVVANNVLLLYTTVVSLARAMSGSYKISLIRYNAGSTRSHMCSKNFMEDVSRQEPCYDQQNAIAPENPFIDKTNVS